MSLAPLVAPNDVADRRGGPFGDKELASACAAVRRECGWHVAPVIENHEVFVDGPVGPRRDLLALPSRLVVSVSEVYDVVSSQVLTGWRRVEHRPLLVRTAGWPAGEGNLRVTVTHGYDECPPDLVAVVVERCRALMSTAPAGARSFARTVGGVTTNTGYVDPANQPAWSTAADGVLDGYRL